tara:strand:- start:710 stop:1468 length:759 start_codon:yes stop_codon:yes gene_type:complete
MLNVQELKKNLNSIYYYNNKINLLFKNHVSSTNDYLNYKYARDLFPLVVITNNQRAARGRGKKKWVSLNQNSLSFSLCLRVDTNNLDLRYLSYLSCVCLYESINTVSEDYLKIKWPNDLYRENKKVSGILIESLSINKEVHLTIGVGININIPNSYSIDQPYSNLSENIDCEKLIYSFCKNIVENIETKNKSKVIEQFNNNLYGYKKQVEINNHENIFRGKLYGINDNGELIIKNDKKTIFIDDINSTMRLL